MTVNFHRFWSSFDQGLNPGYLPVFGKYLFVSIGLFTADQKLNGDTTIYTRQSADGTRRGYECPEERDYYPYWHPTDWTDIAVFVDNKNLCPHYRRESFNVKPKGQYQAAW